MRHQLWITQLQLMAIWKRFTFLNVIIWVYRFGLLTCWYRSYDMSATKHFDNMNKKCRMTLKIISEVQDDLFTIKFKAGIIPNIWKLDLNMSLRARFIILNWDVLKKTATIGMLLMRFSKIPDLHMISK